MATYLDESGEPIGPTYLDDFGEPIVSPESAGPLSRFATSAAHGLGIPTTQEELKEYAKEVGPYLLGPWAAPYAMLNSLRKVVPEAVRGAGEQYEKAMDPRTGGLERTARLVSAAVPVVGPAVAGLSETAGTQFGEGDIAGGLGSSLALGAMVEGARRLPVGQRPPPPRPPLTPQIITRGILETARRRGVRELGLGPSALEMEVARKPTRFVPEEVTGPPETWWGKSPFEEAAPPPARGPVEPKTPVDAAVDATVQQMERRLRTADPTEGRRVPIRGEGQAGPGSGAIEGWTGATSPKAELGLEHIGESSKKIADAIRKDGDNPLYLEARRAAERADPYGYVSEAAEMALEATGGVEVPRQAGTQGDLFATAGRKAKRSKAQAPAQEAPVQGERGPSFRPAEEPFRPAEEPLGPRERRPLPPPPPDGGPGAPGGPGPGSESTRAAMGRQWRRFLLPWLENVERIQKLGPEIGKVVRAYKRDWETPTARQTHAYRTVVDTLSKSEWEATRRALDLGEAPASKKVAYAAGKIREILDDVARRADENGVFVDYTENYFPRRGKDGRWSFDDIVERNAEFAVKDSGGTLSMEVARENARAALHEARRRGEFLRAKKNPSLERERTGQLVDYRTDHAVIGEYIMDANRRISEAKHFGPRLEKASAIFNRMRPDDMAYVEKGLSRLTGREKPVPGQKVLELIRGYEAGSKLGLGPVTQTLGVAPIVARAGVRRTAGGLIDVLRNPRARRMAALESGATFPNISGEFAAGAEGISTSKGIAAKLPHVRATQAMDRFMRTVADATADRLVPDLHRRAVAGDARAAKFLQELGVDPAKPLTREGLLNARKAFSDITQFRVDTTTMPLWASSQYGRTAVQFMSTAYQNARMLSNLVKTRNVRALARYFALATPLVGEVVNDLKAMVKGYGIAGEEFDPTKESTWARVFSSRRVKPTDIDSFALRIGQNIASAGIGMPQLFLERFAHSRNVTDILGPGAGDVAAVSGRLLAGDVPGLAKEAVSRTIPVVGRQVAGEFLRVGDEPAPSAPGWVGRAKDMFRGETQPGEAMRRGVFEGGPGSPSRASLRRTEEANRVARDLEKARAKRYPNLGRKEQKTQAEKEGAATRDARRQKIVDDILAAFAAGKRADAYRLAAKARPQGFKFTPAMMRNLEAAATNKGDQ